MHIVGPFIDAGPGFFDASYLVADFTRATLVELTPGETPVIYRMCHLLR